MQRKMRNPPGGRGKNPFESARENRPSVVTEFNDYGHLDAPGEGAKTIANDVTGPAGKRVDRKCKSV